MALLAQQVLGGWLFVVAADAHIAGHVPYGCILSVQGPHGAAEMFLTCNTQVHQFAKSANYNLAY